ncbi:MAG: ribonuclease H family protein [Fibrobacter sp.]|nr:ribonuclease H family protein [Fibrobacter sp.]
MPKTKFYAIKGPNGNKIVDNWPECDEMVRGVKGVLYKSFGTREEAQAWIDGKEPEIRGGLRVYVDGSFTPSFPKAGWSFVVTEDDKELARGCGITAFDAESRNIDGEVMASFQAMRWLAEHDKKGVICHDYEGIARWARGEWKAKSSIAQQYVRAIQPYLGRVTFEKVAAHTGVKWNELADTLAKGAIQHEQELIAAKLNSDKVEKLLDTAEKATDRDM